VEIFTLSVTSVDASNRLRSVDDDYAKLIGASMAQYGQRAPIEVLPARPDGMYPLISGGHRLRGAQLAGLETIAAIVRAVSDLEADLLEIDENLTRHELNALDRAVFLERRKVIYEELYPEAKHGGSRAKKQADKFVDLLKSFSDATAEKLGVSPRSIDRAVARARNIVPAVREMIGTTWIARRGAHLDAIAKLDAGEQRAVVQLLLQPTEDGSEMTVAEAIRQVRQAPDVEVDVPEADYRKLVRLWEKADVTAKKRFQEYLGRSASTPRGRGK
jgi:ParB family chromosome partitioning protein